MPQELSDREIDQEMESEEVSVMAVAPLYSCTCFEHGMRPIDGSGASIPVILAHAAVAFVASWELQC